MKKIVLILAIFSLVIVIAGCQAKATVLGPQDAEAKALDFINNNLVEPGSKVSIKDFADDGSVYKMKVVLNDGNEVDAFLTKDGKTFFPQGFDIEEISSQSAGENTDQPAENLPKTDKPKVELFIMSHCPYGTQIEKGILPVLALLGDKINFALKFCDYAMHGQTELNEQLNQYCIQKEQNDKLQTYLACFLEAGDGDGCIAKAGIDQSNLKDCVAKADKEYGVTAKFEKHRNFGGDEASPVHIDINIDDNMAVFTESENSDVDMEKRDRFIYKLFKKGRRYDYIIKKIKKKTGQKLSRGRISQIVVAMKKMEEKSK